MIKKLGKAYLCRKLERQVIELRKNNDFKVVAVGGSVGKTSTKLAIAKTLSKTNKVMFQNGNYNDRLTVPLVVFGETEPAIFDVFSWLKLLRRTKRMSRRKYPYEVAVLEVGTDYPGQMAQFEYLKPDIYVLTAIAPEHMEYFDTLDKVADEELVPVNYSKATLINIDDTDEKYLPGNNFISYGFAKNAGYRINKAEFDGVGQQKIEMHLPGGRKLKAQINYLGKQGAKITLAAAAVGDALGLGHKEIEEGLESLKPMSGRMHVLPGKNKSILIDDTYNSSPTSVMAALDVLYEIKAKKRIAILGTMNEMGAASAEMHNQVGAYCNKHKLDLVITIGAEAEKHLAKAAEKAGCKTVSFASPYDAGKYALEQLAEKTVVLAKGSQNGVFAEEALKQLLEHKADVKKLVRQSDYWLKIKAEQFNTSDAQ